MSKKSFKPDKIKRSKRRTGKVSDVQYVAEIRTFSEPARETYEEILSRERKEAIVAAAREALHREGSCEIDPDAEISEGDDNGCYVRSWTWFSFVGTPWDKEKEDDAV